MDSSIQAFLGAIKRFNPTLEGGVVRFRIPHSMIKGLGYSENVSCDRIKNAECDNERFTTRIILADGSEFWLGEKAIAYVHPVGGGPCLWAPCKAYEGVVARFKKVRGRLGSVTDPSINYAEITAWVGD